MDLDDYNRAFFLYCAIVSFQFHPGVKSGDRLTPLEVFAVTYDYFREFKMRGGDLWPGSDQPSEPERVSSVI